jgi:hypothetical protein
MFKEIFRRPAAKAGASVVLTVALSLFGFQAAFGYGGGGGGGGYTTPYGNLSSPNGGQVLSAGSPYQILWSAGGSGILGIELKLSTDGGTTYPTTIVASASNSSYYYWNVPDVSTTNAKVKMSVLGTSITDVSDAVFTIIGSEPMPTTTTEPAAEEEAEDSTTPTTTEEAASVEATAPAEDETRAGAYVPAKAKVNTPTINVDKGLQPPTDRPVLCESGTLIKGSLPAVYFCGKDAKRYVFVNERAFRSWYNDFSSIITISDATLAQIPLGGNVTYKPGVRLVKITTDPKVYAIARGGWLRWVRSESAAVALYGADWNKMVDDVADSFFVNYRIGDPVAE